MFSGRVLYVAPGRSSTSFFALSRISGLPVRLECVEVSKGPIRESGIRLLHSLGNAEGPFTAPLEVIEGPNHVVILIEHLAGQPLQSCEKIFRSYKDPSLTLLKLLCGYARDLATKPKSSMLHAFLWNHTTPTTLQVTTTGSLRLYLEPEGLFSSLPQSIRLIGSPTQYLVRLFRTLLTVFKFSTSKTISLLDEMSRIPSKLQIDDLWHHSILKGIPYHVQPPHYSAPLNIVNIDSERFRQNFHQYLRCVGRFSKREYLIPLLRTFLNPQFKVLNLGPFLQGDERVLEAYELAMENGDYGILAMLGGACPSARLSLTPLMERILSDEACVDLKETDRNLLWKQAKYGYTALMFAILRNRIGLCQQILPLEANLRNRCEESPRDIARKVGLFELMDQLDRLKLDPDEEGNTSLITAVLNNDLDSARRFIYMAGVTNIENRSALLIATMKKLYPLLTILAPAEAHIVHSLPSSYGRQATNGMTALHWAVLNNDLEAVQLLKTYGAGITTGANQTSLMLAASLGLVDIAKELVDLERGLRDNKGRTALMVAAYSNHPEVIDVLLDSEQRLVDENHWSALEIAVRRNHLECIRALAPAEAKEYYREAIDAVHSSAFIRSCDKDEIIATIRAHLD
ncbi:Ankyrin repeat protein 1 [Giardia muris]|uniref:Ankyrin repeat protein 1 n=1 Tax=Giardia muris TaxID=5742 RepID=A0A4Z1T146_GIAMU|nr:Ankyrin repeat protein 1 [Giardia muris]|eukprot:TNJ29428.1 Ankyrin repeat protein 1 [Giardia muris]